MDTDAIAWVIVGAVTAGFVQGLTGFGFALVAMSFWAWALEPQLAAVLAVFGGLCGQLLAAFKERRGIAWKLAGPFVLGGLAGLPLGLWLLPHLDAQSFRAGIGALLALWCPLMLFSSHLPQLRFANPRADRLADALAGACGGFMGPLGGFTGALPTLWCTLKGLERNAQRSIIQSFNLALLAVTMATYLAGGIVTQAMLPMMAVVAPALVLPTWLGMKLYARISPQAFRQVVLTLLTASGVVMLGSVLRQWL
jgi:uncharacterized protein